MSEKLNLEWIDFQSNVSQSFGVFRHEDYLQDVTLVTDDNTQISAHKLILSACSEYFKGLFQTNAKHTYPLVCLNDVDGKMLGYILDYMYHGQVQILEESLDIFIKVAQRFKLDGIKVAKETGIGKADPDKKTEREGNGGQDRGGGGEYYEGERPGPSGPAKETGIVKANPDEKNSGKTFNETSKDKQNGEERQGVEDIPTNQYDLDVSKYMKKCDDGKVECTFCGKMDYPPSKVKRHIETHFSGMNIVCQLCHTVFKTRESLRVHMYRHKYSPVLSTF